MTQQNEMKKKHNIITKKYNTTKYNKTEKQHNIIKHNNK